MPAVAGQRQRQPEHRVKEVLGQDDGERAEASRTAASAPKAIGSRLTRRASSRPWRCAPSAASAGLGRRLHVAQQVAGRPRGLELQADGVQAVLVEQSSRRSRVATSNDFIMMMASVGQTCTHSSQNSHAYSSSVKVLAKFRFSALSISTLMTCGRADVLAEPAADAVLLARLLVVGQREHAAEAVGIGALHVGIVHRDRLAEEVDEGRRAWRGRRLSTDPARSPQKLCPSSYAPAGLRGPPRARSASTG